MIYLSFNEKEYVHNPILLRYKLTCEAMPMFQLEEISTYIKSVIAVTIGEIAIHNLPKGDGTFCSMPKN